MMTPLLLLFNLILCKETIPKYFKTAVVTPLYKAKGSVACADNYRPIHTLPFVNKMFEKITGSSFVLDVNQHGFRREQREPLGDSKAIAFKRFLSLETKLQRNPELGDAYKKAMRELQEEGHMEPIPSHQLKSFNGTYYLTHHAIVKEASSTTKLRIVFDASARTTATQSLNEQLLVGPRIQQDLFAILVWWRYWLIPLFADIRKMNLCILTSSSDRDYQRLFWIEKPTDQLGQFRLNKVTFGEASAPFQAIRTLHQLAEDLESIFPEASRVLKKAFYVDNCLTGRNHVEELSPCNHCLWN
ncbi:unnamed protein product [Allacma fusca]|uniref:Uncharacterized protein n=1 Tax=Allacma fusca TaxID=39272 RepID=A0A8J2KGR9_9HEXA|nr:unnamed protein product [Allacma fusca]